ncbi:MAG TPA: hypothetical protein VFZ73_13170 [Gemmatimonadaceae bacterium]
MRTDEKPRASFSESQAQRILARAAEIEGTVGTRFTVDDLRQIASTAGIDAHALESAINESHVAVEPDVGMTAPGPLTAREIVLMAGTGAALGALAIAADNLAFGGASAIAVFGPSAVYTAWKAVKHSLRKGIPGLLRDLAVVFGSFTAAIMAIDGLEGASAAMTWSLLCGMLGAGILSLRGARVSSSVVEVADQR